MKKNRCDFFLAPTTTHPEARSAGSSTDSGNSQDMEEFRPVAMVTRRVGASGEELLDSLGGDSHGELVHVGPVWMK